ncbi:uncharacterized protein LOC129920004 [Episyrphus balteatus]|uniref:uncharacterized protein LOC129920004 n=1 Tax=Episyrphus balteatus TaxID=286459 RepID=UPI002485A3B8|nr:uncharacterized protein LOC129920004 [Episyrphus balteatus]
MSHTLGLLTTLLCGLVFVNSFAIESRSSGVNEEVYGKYVCNGKQNGARIMVPGSCSKYFQCKAGKSVVNTCASPNKFFDSSSGNCVATSSCIEPKGDCSTAKPKPTPPCNNKKTTATTQSTPMDSTSIPSTGSTPCIGTACEIKSQIQQEKVQKELEEQFIKYFAIPGQKCESSGGSCRGLANGTIIPHKNNCKMYLACFSGCGAEILCPASLSFNQKTLLCDRPENVKCTA